VNYDFRKNILLTAHVYYKSGEGHYRKLLTIHKEYDYIDYPYVRSTITYLLNELLSGASLAYSGDTGKGEELSMDRINIKVSDKWAAYPFATSTFCCSGRFRTFEDFRNGRVTPGELKARLIASDSTYKINISGSLDSPEDSKDWAVLDSGNYYVRIYKNIFLPLYRRGPGFVFYVPWTLPDMYALLSLEENAAKRGSGASHTDNLLVDLSAMAMESAVQVSSERARARKIVADGLKHGYRYCVVDMDTGDFLYSVNPGYENEYGK
jgi:hypothetical protein